MKNHKLIFEIAKKIIKNNDNVIFIFCGLGININEVLEKNSILII